MENIYVKLIFLGIMLAIVIVSSIVTNYTAKNIITNYLQEKGAKNIVVIRDWFDSDRNTKTFSVEFIHPNGNKISTRCKLRHVGIFVDEEMFWSEPTNLEPPKTEIEQIETSRLEHFELSEKIRSRLDKKLPTYEISTVLSISNSEDKIVMMKYIASFSNVFRCKKDGDVIWQAELPTSSGDVYTNIAWQEKQLTAFSRSCIAVTINVETGKILTPEKTS